MGLLTAKKEEKPKKPKTTKEIIDDFYKRNGKDTLIFTKYQLIEFDFPRTDKKYYLVTESYNTSIEENYFWILNHLYYEFGFVEIDKITDLFSASEHSTFFGVSQQRVGINQDKISQYIGAIGKMIKDIFQLVREIRIIDERLEIYYKSKKLKGFKYENKDWEKERTKETESNFEITLKGLYVDMAEGGPKNPGSVWGLSQQLQYTTLPDLFFTIHPSNDKEINELVDPLEFNKQVKWVLKRKFQSYFQWKKHTYVELTNRKKYTVKYFRQHWNVIKMYISWIKPYLKNLKALQADRRKNDTPYLVSAFENSMIEIEIMGKSLPQGNSKCYSCINVHFEYRTVPQMNYNAEGYQRAPLHIGELKMMLRGYTWTQKEIDEYKKIRELEDFELAVEVEQSLRDAMDALGGDIEKYLEEAGENIEKKDNKEEEENDENKREGLLDPFLSILDNIPGVKKKEKPSEESIECSPEERTRAKDYYVPRMWFVYKNFKKSHGFLQW
jgi:hypothetical protein